MNAPLENAKNCDCQDLKDAVANWIAALAFGQPLIVHEAERNIVRAYKRMELSGVTPLMRGEP